jgi:hypothetical protein
MQIHGSARAINAGKATRFRQASWAALLACTLLVTGWFLYREFAQPPLLPATGWTTNTEGWDMKMPEFVRSAGVAANDIRFEQNGKDLRIAFRRLTIEKHPSIPEAHIIAVAVRIDPPISPEQAPQAMEGILTAQNPALTRTTVVISVPGAVTCLKTVVCTFWLELTLQRPGMPPHVEQSRRMPVPERPVV